MRTPPPTRLVPVALLALAVFTLGATPDVHAKDRFGVAVKAGTYGLGVDFGVRLTDFVTVRASVNRADFSPEETIDDIEYEGDFSLGGDGVIVDVFPLRGQFRVSAGLFSNRNEVDLTARPTAPVFVGDTLYTPAEIGSLTGRIDFDSTAGYLGVGVGNVAKGSSRVRFLFDAGVVLQGAGEVGNLASSTGIVSPGDLAIEAIAIEDDIEDLEFWPVLSFGAAFRF